MSIPIRDFHHGLLGVRQEPGYSQAVFTWPDGPFPMGVLSILECLLTKFKYIVMDAFIR